MKIFRTTDDIAVWLTLSTFNLILHLKSFPSFFIVVVTNKGKKLKCKSIVSFDLLQTFFLCLFFLLSKFTINRKAVWEMELKSFVNSIQICVLAQKKNYVNQCFYTLHNIQELFRWRLVRFFVFSFVISLKKLCCYSDFFF